SQLRCCFIPASQRKFGQGSYSCRVCSNCHGLIHKYMLNMCRQCFQQYSKDIGFIKLD
uniref:Small ribosomal subunit protein uS14 n=1 Tax=Mus spicilegus TaxID=10103 RepID=A0A8C6GKL8_MUSSI